MIVALSGKKFSGKTFAADHLVSSFGFKKLSFASPLKKITQLLFGFNDLSVFGNDQQKNQGNAFLGVSARELLQYIGTDILRNNPLFQPADSSSETIFVHCMKKQIQEIMKNDLEAKIVIDDVRFQDEIDMLKNEFDCKFFHIEPKNSEHLTLNMIGFENDHELFHQHFYPGLKTMDPIAHALAHLGIFEKNTNIWFFDGYMSEKDKYFSERYDALKNALNDLPKVFPQLPYLGNSCPSERNLISVMYTNFHDFWWHVQKQLITLRHVPLGSSHHTKNYDQHSSETQDLKVESVPITNDRNLPEEEFLKYVDLIPSYININRELAKAKINHE